MPLSHLITRCPACQTAFKLEQRQLQQAGGRVRCGVCHHVFMAAQHMLSSQPEPTSSSPQPNTASRPPIKPSADRPSLHHVVVSPKAREPDAAATPSPQVSAQPTPVHNDKRPASAHAAQAQPAAPARPTAIPANSKPAPIQRHQDAAKATSHAAAKVSSDTPASNNTQSSRPDADVLTLSPLQALENLHDEEHLHWHEPAPKLSNGLLAWTLLLLLALPLQWIWWQRQQLAWQPPLGAFIQWSCSSLPCQLHPRSDVDKISSTALSIRDHQEYSNLLQVNLTLLNQAGYNQPYPVLGLVFYDLQGHPRAQRYITSTDYLGGDLEDAKEMPINTPVNISFTLQDPGAPSVGYALHLYAADARIPSFPPKPERVE